MHFKKVLHDPKQTLIVKMTGSLARTLSNEHHSFMANLSASICGNIKKLARLSVLANKCSKIDDWFDLMI